MKTYYSTLRHDMHKDHIAEDDSFTSRLIAAKQERRKEAAMVLLFWAASFAALALIALIVYAIQLS